MFAHSVAGCAGMNGVSFPVLESQIGSAIGLDSCPGNQEVGTLVSGNQEVGTLVSGVVEGSVSQAEPLNRQLVAPESIIQGQDIFGQRRTSSHRRPRGYPYQANLDRVGVCYTPVSRGEDFQPRPLIFSPVLFPTSRLSGSVTLDGYTPVPITVNRPLLDGMEEEELRTEV